MKTMNKMYKLLCRGVRCGIALFLCLIMCVCSLTLTIFAQDASSNPITENVELPSELPLEEGDFTLSALSTMKVEDVKLPETITLAEALEKEHVNRLYAQEKNLNTAIFQNRSGTKTAYVFDKPIKYVNETGETKDIDTSISSTKLSGYLYAMTENSIQSYFGATTDKGVMFRFKEFSFSIIPEGSQIVSRAVLGENNREITYYNAFGANTAIRYSTQLTGVKEDIILSSDVGKYSFRFLLTTVGISPVKLGNGHWGLADGEGTPIIDFGSIVINDSAGKQVWGEMSVIPRSSGGYIVEITAPKEFLQSSETVYPVYIDPSVTTVEGGGSYVSIHDYGIYTDQMYYNDGNILPNQHFVNASYGKVIYKLADFYESGGLFKNYDDYEIGKVTFRVYSYSTFNSVIKANPMNSACADNERLYLSQSLFNDYSTKNSSSASKSVSVNGTLSFDITEIARGWARYNKSISREVYENPANGFVLSKGGSGDIYLASTEASGNANVSYIVDYSLYDGIYYIKNKASSTYLKTGNTLNQTSDSYPLSCSSGRNYQCSFVVKYVGDQKYLILPMYNMDYALYKNGTAHVLTSSPGNAYYWYISATPTHDAYVFKNCSSGYVLSYGTNVSVVAEKASTDSNYTQTNWYMYRYACGSQQYRVLNDSQIGSINCHGYAMMRYDRPVGWDNIAMEVGNLILNLKDYNDEEITTVYATYLREDFIRWLNAEGYNYVEETDFSKNGENRSLSSNQYRVLLRAGTCWIPSGTTGRVDKDYHFWYQTSDGRWAQKFATGEPPTLLPYGATPHSLNSGGWNSGNSIDFYDSQIYCFIITVT